MTEEEAVASMEDVDVIARRIFQERGEGIQPPHYPDPPRRERTSRETADGPEISARSRRRWVVPVVLGLVIVSLFGALRMLYGFGGYGFYIGNEGIRIGNLLTIDDSGIRVGPNGSMVSVTEEGIAVGHTPVVKEVAPVDRVESAAPEAFVDGEYTVVADEVRKLTVGWVAGDVTFESWYGDEILFSEFSEVELGEDEALRYSLEDRELSIQFTSDKIKNFQGKKNLTIWIPESLVLDELEVNTVSGSVMLGAICGQQLKLNTVSGDCTVLDGRFDKISTSTISGDLYLEGSVQEVEHFSTSGDLYISNNNILWDVEVDSVSGDVEIELPAESGFDLTYDTIGGELKTGAIPLKKDGNGQYTSGDGRIRMDVETSGDLTLIEAE